MVTDIATSKDINVAFKSYLEASETKLDGRAAVRLLEFVSPQRATSAQLISA